MTCPYACISAFVESLHQSAFSLAVAIPDLVSAGISLCLTTFISIFHLKWIFFFFSIFQSEKSDSKLPLYGRIVGRGDASELRSDATSLELFAVSIARNNPLLLGIQILSLCSSFQAANVNTDPYRVVEAFDRTAQFYYSPAENPIILE